MSAEREKDLLRLLDTVKDDPASWDVVIDATRAVIADNGSLRQQITTLRGAVAATVPVIQTLWTAVREKVIPVWNMIGPYLDPEAPMGAEWDSRVEAGYEDDPAPKLRDGDGGTCATCGLGITYLAYVHGGSWWHDKHAEDGHDPLLGGPA